MRILVLFTMVSMGEGDGPILPQLLVMRCGVRGRPVREWTRHETDIHRGQESHVAAFGKIAPARRG